MQPHHPGRWCDQHQRFECTQSRSRGRGACHGPAVTGEENCRMHLGQPAQPVIAEAELQKQAAAELARLGVAPVSDPLSELARLAGQAIAWKDAMGAKVNELSGGIRYQGGQGTEQLRAEIALFERAMDRCSTVLVAMARLDVDDRLAGIRERTAAMLERALDAALAASGVGLDGQQAARQAFRTNLRVVQAQPENPKALA